MLMSWISLGYEHDVPSNPPAFPIVDAWTYGREPVISHRER